jgi:hypothetical protein
MRVRLTETGTRTPQKLQRSLAVHPAILPTSLRLSTRSVPLSRLRVSSAVIRLCGELVALLGEGGGFVLGYCACKGRDGGGSCKA